MAGTSHGKLKEMISPLGSSDQGIWLGMVAALLWPSRLIYNDRRVSETEMLGQQTVASAIK